MAAQKELGEHYLVEIIARADTVRHRCDALLSNDFPSDAPRALTQTVQRICDYLTKAAQAIFTEIDWSAPDEEVAQDFRLLRLTDRIVQELAQELRYVEGARTERLPWSIVPSFEALVREILPDVQIMLRAMWHYNYAFHLQDQRAFFRSILLEHGDYVPTVDLDRDVLAPLTRPFHIISFPSLEQKHILLHSLLGHEVGHLLVDRYLTPVRESAFAAATKREIEEYTDVQVAAIPDSYGPEVKRVLRDQFLSQNTRTAIQLWRRALEELLSDLAGVSLFGPASLFSTLEMAIQGGYDVLPAPTNDFYPPWRMRLRHVWTTLHNQGGWFDVPVELFAGDAARKERLDSRAGFIAALVADRRDERELRKDTLAAIAYREAENEIPRGEQFLLATCGLATTRPNAETLYRALPPLIGRLDNSIPPNAFESHLDDERVPTFVEIINAAWFHRVSLDPLANGTAPEQAAYVRNRLNNLALKAIEFSELARGYSAWTQSRESSAEH